MNATALSDEVLGELREDIYQFLRSKTRNTVLAEDITQDVILNVIRKWDSYDPSRSLKSWAITIANNLVCDVWRSAHVRGSVQELTNQHLLTEENVYAADMREVIQHALASLPESYREIITLHYLHGMTHSEVSQATGVPLSSLRGRFRLARKILKENRELISHSQ